MSDNRAVLTLDQTTFDEVVGGSSVPVLVDFWAEWCAPCRALSPIFDAVASLIGDQAVLARVETDPNPELVERFGIRSIPTLIFFQNGQELERLVGVVSKDELTSKLQALAA